MTGQTAGDNGMKKTVIPVEIPVSGSLGLLALGAVGLKAWREKRIEAEHQTSKKNNNE